MVRPTKLKPAIQESICQKIRAGLGNDEAARVSGIDPATLYRWKKSDARFREAVLKAAAQGEYDDLLVIQEASVNRYDNDGNLVRRGSWQAAAWRRERLQPQKYGMRWSGELSGRNGKPLIPDETKRVDTSRFTKEQLDKLIMAADEMIKVKSADVAPNENGNGHHPV